MITIEELSQYLDDDAFPATKDDCILMASENDAPFEIINLLVDMPSDTYDSLDDLVTTLNAKFV